MFIEEVTIDGFKSYAQRTVVPNFDKTFNAITGLNGTGKSNILDSICFVLGITNLSQVRAGSLQELVYKQGQAGVTKATVSVTFNNSDRATSPPGYEHCEQLTVTRQVVIGGRNKYLINGHVAQPGRVQDLFRSVQLNVNNPHFLIMQGRITKVLNMKPPEILSMLEEAAGTRMYESKKDGALKTLEKKEGKMAEINKLLEDEIVPELNKLRKERGAYMAWASANAQLDALRRFCIAHAYAVAEGARDARGVRDIQARLTALATSISELEAEAANAGARITSLEAAKAAAESPAVKALAAAVADLAKTVVKTTTAAGHAADQLAAERAAAARASAAAVKASSELADKAAALAAAEAAIAGGRQGAETLAAASASADRTLSSLLRGGSATAQGADADKSLAEQLAAAIAGGTAARSSIKQASVRVQHASRELATAKKAVADDGGKSTTLARDLAAAEAALATAQAKVAAVGHDADAAAAASVARDVAAAAVKAARDAVDAAAAHLAGLDFRYADPEPGFDRARVKGVLARLIRVAEPAVATALEVAAGGKLFQVVVDTDATGRALLSKGQLRSRVTLIPLNRIDGRGASAKQVAAADRISRGDARLALTLVGCTEDVRAAVAYVFGGTFICADGASARAVAFHPDVNANCVTLEGDLLNPAGLITGGSRAASSSVLARLATLAALEADLATAEATLAAADAAVAAHAATAKRHAAASSEVSLHTCALDLLRGRVAASASAQLADRVAALTAEVNAATAEGAAAEAAVVASAAAETRLRAEMASFGTGRDARVKTAEAAAKAAKKAAGDATAALAASEAAVLALAAEREAAAEDAAAQAEAATSAGGAVATLAAENDKLIAAMTAATAAHAERASALEAQRAKSRECDAALAALAAQRDAARAHAEDAALEVRKQEVKLARAHNEAAEAGAKLKDLSNSYPWIATEKHLFGRPGGDYDFGARSPEEANKTLTKATEEQNKLAKTINKKVVAMFDQADRECQELSAKRGIVNADKAKIEQVIAELDEKKKVALKAVWTKVNRDFGAIFSTLLPGTTAKLEPPENGSFLDGLEVKVAFGGVWKQSLTELSGGQRSLLALSLILALLLFKPAPIYILDEVDAALDLSHTQNIGRMIRTHFPYSQFVVVSLKEGMFNNANVIFRTKFVDGTSCVTRTVPALKDKDTSAAPAAPAVDEAKRRRMVDDRRPVHVAGSENEPPTDF